MLWSGLMLGLLMGIRHALDADHLAAVMSLSTQSKSTHHTIRLGLVWGLGHTATLFLVGLAILVLDVFIPTNVSNWLEFLVGGMLVVLGLSVMHRMWKERIHFHAHDHGDGVQHLHAHGHANDNKNTQEATTAHYKRPHIHMHQVSWKALVVGMVHGLAGSAPLILLTLQATSSVVWGLAYILIFGLGSMIGMGVLTLAISFPLRVASSRLTLLYNTLCIAIGFFTVGLGGTIMVTHFQG